MKDYELLDDEISKELTDNLRGIYPENIHFEDGTEPIDLTKITFDEMKEFLPKPVLSICVITTEEDLEEFGHVFFPNLPRSPEVELVLVKTIKSEIEKTVLISEEINLTQAEFHYTNLLDFAGARNYCKSLAKGTWIMSIDTDEILAKHSHEQLLDILKDTKHYDDISAFNVGVVSSQFDFIAERYVRTINNSTRIFRNSDEINWEGKLHEVILLKDDKYFNLPMVFEHTGYAVTIDEMISKFERNIKGISWEITDTKRFDFYIEYLKNSIEVYQKLKENKQNYN